MRSVNRSLPARLVDQTAHRGRCTSLQREALYQSADTVYRETEAHDYQRQAEARIGSQVAACADAYKPPSGWFKKVNMPVVFRVTCFDG